MLTTGVQLISGVPLNQSYIWSFTVGSPAGQAKFLTYTSYEVGTAPLKMVAVDLDGDNWLDITTANDVSNDISVLLSNGNGTWEMNTTYYCGVGPSDIFAPDIDSDRDMDLMVVNRGVSHDGSISVFFNIGDGTFSGYDSYPMGNNAISIIAHDLDGDADLDLAILNQHLDRIGILINDGSGLFAPLVAYATGSDSDLSWSPGNCLSRFLNPRFRMKAVCQYLNCSDGRFGCSYLLKLCLTVAFCPGILYRTKQTVISNHAPALIQMLL